MQSKAASVEHYLAKLPAARREALDAVRKIILENLDPDFEEGMQYGMIGYYVPHRIYPAGYHCDPRQPLPFVSLGSQKNHMSVHMMFLYGDSILGTWFRERWATTGKKLDMGKCCLRFNNIEALALDVLGAALQRVSAKSYIERYESVIRRPSGSASARAQKKGDQQASAPEPAKAKARAALSAKKKVAKRNYPRAAWISWRNGAVQRRQDLGVAPGATMKSTMHRGSLTISRSRSPGEQSAGFLVGARWRAASRPP